MKAASPVVGRKILSRPEGKLEAAQGRAIDDRDLRALLGNVAPQGSARAETIAHYLSAANGWRDAGALLGGAFASGKTAGKRGLNGGKEE